MIQIGAAFLGTCSFAIIFESPKKYYLWCGLIGAIGWLIYLTVLDQFHTEILANFVSALVLTILSRNAAFYLRAPVTIFLITGIFCLVPGIGAYNFTYLFFIGNHELTIAAGIRVIKAAIAISIGITLGYEIPVIVKRPHLGD